ncbi:T9SS type A sorting domain-containing protein [Xanthocytophaga flava]
MVYQATQRSGEEILNLSGLSKGMYWVTLQTNGGVIYSRKVVK